MRLWDRGAIWRCLASYTDQFSDLAQANSNNIFSVISQTGILEDYPKAKAWAAALLASNVVEGSVADVFPAEFEANLIRRGTYAATLLQQAAE